MNTFNRAAMIIILLGVIFATALGIVLLLFAPALPVGLLNNLSRILAGDPRLRELQLELTVTGLIVFVPSIILLLLEVRRTARDSIRISKVSGSEAHLSTQAVAQSLIYYVDSLDGVVRVRPRLHATNTAIDVRLDVQTTPDVDVRAKTEEISRTARNVVEERLGLKLNRLNIHIHHTPLPVATGGKLAMPPASATGAQQAAPPAAAATGGQQTATSATANGSPPPPPANAQLQAPAATSEKQNPLP